MGDFAFRRRVGRSWGDIIAQVATGVATAVVWGLAVYGILTWSSMPEYPPPTANESLLLLRRAITMVFVTAGLLLVPFALGVRALRLLGAGVAMIALGGSAFARQAYRDEAWVFAIDVTTVLLLVAALSLVAVALGFRRG